MKIEMTITVADSGTTYRSIQFSWWECLVMRRQVRHAREWFYGQPWFEKELLEKLK